VLLHYIGTSKCTHHYALEFVNSVQFGDISGCNAFDFAVTFSHCYKYNTAITVLKAQCLSFMLYICTVMVFFRLLCDMDFLHLLH
jgi:hypothetical protein